MLLPELKLPSHIHIESSKMYLDFLVKLYISAKANNSLQKIDSELWFLGEIYDSVGKLWPDVGAWQQEAILKQIISIGEQEYKKYQAKK